MDSGYLARSNSAGLITVWLEVRVLPGPPRILSNREISRRRPRSPQLAGFCGCVSVSADTVSGLKAILGRLSLGRGIPFPRCRSIWPAQPDHGAGACLTAGTTGCSEQRSNASTGSQAGWSGLLHWPRTEPAGAPSSPQGSDTRHTAFDLPPYRTSKTMEIIMAVVRCDDYSPYGMTCPQCNDLMIAPRSSAYVSCNSALHCWSCDTCGHDAEIFDRFVRLSGVETAFWRFQT